MKLKHKLLIGVIITLGVIILGTNVNATEFTSRILNTNEFVLKVLAGTFSTGENIDKLTQAENDLLAELNKNGSVRIWKEDVESWENIFCIDSNVDIPKKGSLNEAPKYTKDKEETYTNDAISYILSYPRIDNDLGKELREQIIQVALWLVGLNSDGVHDFDPTIGQELAEEAKAFEEFRKNYGGDPIILETASTTSKNIVGPFKIQYSMAYCNTAMFGNITEAILYDENENIIDRSKWDFTDENGNILKNKVGEQEYLYPISEQEFYIKANDDISGKVNMTFKFNNLQATGTILKLTGTYEPLYSGDWYGKCAEHLKMFENCGDEDAKSEKQIGYKIKKETREVNCLTRIYREQGDVPEEITKYLIVSRTYRGTVAVEEGKPGYLGNPKTKKVYCGDYYTVVDYNTGKVLRTVSVGNCGKTHDLTVYVFSKCPGASFNGSLDEVDSVCCDNCAEVWKAILKPCGKPTGEHVDKEGETQTNALCGYKYTTDVVKKSQPLAIGIGERTPSETTLSLEPFKFNNKEVDISLRKYITAINGKEITSRIPQVDVTPLKNGEKTAKYNHTKETLTVQKGDLVTYTIRVYNEGELDAYSKEIKDYLPENLEFVSGTVNEVDYKWTVSRADDGGTIITTSYLSDRKLEKFNQGEGNYRSELDYAEVKVICKVKESVELKQRIVNIAEISNYAFYDEEQEQIVDIQNDVDSTQDNVNLPSNADLQNYNGNGADGNYVRGQEDDDDFESVVVLYDYTDIGGTVWLDAVEGKQEERDNILTKADKKLSGIIVRLYKSSDINTPIAETKTDINGKYVFESIVSNEKYVITFEYGGQQYIPVDVVELNNENYNSIYSAGTERGNDRNELNAKFHEIVKGTAKNSNGKETVGLSYTRDENKHTSTLIRDKNFYNSTKINASTVEFRGDATYAQYINLGLVERAQVNLGLMIDVKNAEVSVNGQTVTYDYNGRDEGTALDIEAKAADINRVYNQAIYKSDYNFRITDYNQTGVPVRVDQENELQAYVTYKIKVKNYSSKYASVSELSAYVAPEYNIVESWYEKGNSKGTVTWVSAGEANGYKTIKTSSVNGVNIGANEDLYVYAKVQVAKDASGGIMLGEKYIIAEITGYTTNEGLIDTNSEPGNIDISNWDNYVKTYEDDTDRAPGLNLYLTEATRTMTGFVWEDSVSTQDSDGVNIGDGIKNGNEQNKNGITVQLIEKVTIDGQVYEYIWQETQTGSNKVSYMDREGKLHECSKEVEVGTGEYKFTDYVPGTYIVRFKYGDTEASIDLNGQDYKSTTYKGFGDDTSSAKDNKDRRLAVMNYSIEQTNEKGEILSGKDSSLHQELINNTWMYADTVETITIGINDENPGHNVNFGLLKRPISKLVAIKEVNGIKISNKGIIYVDTANGINTGLREAYGSYYIELDDELINGAHLEVSYKIRIENQGEKDTLYNYFEGEEKYGANQHEIIKTQALLVYDYPEKLGYDEDSTINPSWTKDGVDIRILSEEVQSKISGGSLVVKATEKLDKALKPGESTDTIYMTLSKIMAAGGNDDLSYSNKVEIVNRLNEVGRRDEESTPGNYVPLSKVTELDTGKADVTITDPTGETRIYYGLGIGAGILLIAGIVLIKRFVLSKKK